MGEGLLSSEEELEATYIADVVTDGRGQLAVHAYLTLEYVVSE